MIYDDYSIKAKGKGSRDYISALKDNLIIGGDIIFVKEKRIMKRYIVQEDGSLDLSRSGESCKVLPANGKLKGLDNILACLNGLRWEVPKQEIGF